VLLASFRGGKELFFGIALLKHAQIKCSIAQRFLFINGVR